MFKKAEQLDGSNYRSWLFTMEMFLKANGLWSFILIGLSERYRYLSVNLEEQIEEISFQNLTARLTEEERRLNPTTDSGTTQTIARPTIGQQEQVTAYRVQCRKCGRNDHTSDQCGSRCDFCGGFNHSECNCRTKVFQENKSGIHPGAREKSNLYRR
jgi:hypothetical protein